MKLPFVSRELYETTRMDLLELRAKYDLLRQQGFTLPVPPKAGRVVGPGPSPEVLAAKRMHDELVESMARDIEAWPGVDKGMAKAEADRLRRVAFGEEGLPL